MSVGTPLRRDSPQPQQRARDQGRGWGGKWGTAPLWNCFCFQSPLSPLEHRHDLELWEGPNARSHRFPPTAGVCLGGDTRQHAGGTMGQKGWMKCKETPLQGHGYTRNWGGLWAFALWRAGVFQLCRTYQKHQGHICKSSKAHLLPCATQHARPWPTQGTDCHLLTKGLTTDDELIFILTGRK